MIPMKLALVLCRGGKMQDTFKTLVVASIAALALTACSSSKDQATYFNPAGADSQIVNGDAVEANDPIAASTVDLYYVAPNSTKVMNFCSGTIIGEDTILSAAHCFVDASQALKITVEELASRTRVGFGYDIVSKPDDSRITFVAVHHVTVNPDYKMDNLDNAEKGEALPDVSVLKLVSSVPASAKVVPMLADASEIVKGTKLTLAGFGVVRGGFFPTPAKRLMKVEVSIENPTLNPTQFRYQSVGGKTACSGDSGGPAYLIAEDGSLTVAGVTSWGDGNCEQFGVYTSVPALLTWIEATQAL